MSLIHHVVSGSGGTPVVFVHGFACAHTDWAAQVAHFAPGRTVVAVDLRGHGATPGEPADAVLERFGSDVAELMRALALPPAVIVGHSMGCRVVTEAALQAPEHARAVILTDGSQFPDVTAALKSQFARPDGFADHAKGLFVDMFTAKSDPAAAAAIVARAGRLKREIGEKLLLDMIRYDTTRLPASYAALRVPVLAIQTTTRGADGKRSVLRPGQTTPYLDMLRTANPAARIEIIPDTGHFPQIDEPARTNAAMADFLAGL